MKKTAIYPGSFDPVTNGHLDVLKRALKIFDKVIIAVGENPNKRYLFDSGERKGMIQKVTKGLNVEVDHFSGLLVDFAKKKKADAIIRGLRAVSDFDSEFQNALMNRKLDSKIETIFIMTRGMYSYLSASIVKEAACLGAKLDGMVPPHVEKMLKEKFKAG
ncbi:pantetheine-phosphate adenylyltransferase [Candidatus Woesearchaeota archaeon]|nr:pantetheine-phosphate adenylyltransferase [Candidatus Woesearchaeota archaeon]